LGDCSDRLARRTGWKFSPNQVDQFDRFVRFRGAEQIAETPPPAVENINALLIGPAILRWLELVGYCNKILGVAAVMIRGIPGDIEIVAPDWSTKCNVGESGLFVKFADRRIEMIFTLIHSPARRDPASEAARIRCFSEKEQNPVFAVKENYARRSTKPGRHHRSLARKSLTSPT
jgi:hypothetical protein